MEVGGKEQNNFGESKKGLIYKKPTKNLNNTEIDQCILLIVHL
jgi:hypothetical protein